MPLPPNSPYRVSRTLRAATVVFASLALAALLANPLAARAFATSAPQAAGTAQAAGAAQAKAPADAAGALRALEEQWAAGVVKRDRALFEKLLAPGFVYTEDARMMSRAALITDISTGTDTVLMARNDEMQVHEFGETAVVTGWLTLAGRGPGGAFRRRLRFTDTWVRRAGSWQIVAAQDYLVPDHRKVTDAVPPRVKARPPAATPPSGKKP